MRTQRNVKEKGELLGRFGPDKIPPIDRPFPGHGGPRPTLSFVVNTLAGNDAGMVRLHLSFTRNLSTEDEEAYHRIVGNKKLVAAAEASMIGMMRQLADLWIDSGKSGPDDTFDNPATRNVEYAPGDGVGPIRGIFYNLIGNLVRYPAIRLDGTQDTREIAFGMTAEDFGWRSGKEAAEQFGSKVAMYWFARLLDSPFSRHLARCDECRAYFGYERAPKTAIKSGVYCDKCKAQGSARRMRSGRETLQLEMIEAAASASAEWEYSRTNPDKRNWIARSVNKRLGKRLKVPITRKWVSQNLDRIDAAILRRNDAKN
jgi:hypothetical protein